MAIGVRSFSGAIRKRRPFRPSPATRVCRRPFVRTRPRPERLPWLCLAHRFIQERPAHGIPVSVVPHFEVMHQRGRAAWIVDRRLRRQSRNVNPVMTRPSRFREQRSGRRGLAFRNIGFGALNRARPCGRSPARNGRLRPHQFRTMAETSALVAFLIGSEIVGGELLRDEPRRQAADALKSNAY